MSPWELVSSGPGALHLRLYESWGWMVFAGLLAYGAWGFRRGLRGERRRRTGRWVASAGVALVGAGIAFFTVRDVDVRLENGVLRWAETRLPGRVTRRGELRAAELAEVVVAEKAGRRGPSYRPLLRLKDGTEHLIDETGQARATAVALAEALRSGLAPPK